MSTFAKAIRPYVDAELREAALLQSRQLPAAAFAHLERAHVLGQTSTVQHVRAHWHMLIWSLRQRSWREGIGQILRLLGAASKTAVGLVPAGNTGGSNISPFKPLPIAPELQACIARARNGRP